MPRIIGENVRNKLIIKDPFSGDPIILYYRSPTAEERVSYKSAQWERVEGKIRSRITEARQDFGDRILLGFQEGSFQYRIGDQTKIFSSDPDSSNYDPSWRELLKKYASDVIEALAEHAFEGTIGVGAQEYAEKN